MSGVGQLLSYSELDAYARLHRIAFSAFDIEALEAMDIAFVGTQLKLKRGAE